ncbi:uncharacterized protein LOC8285624 isoform X1 [Ricinus communis]|uniref:Uncharacterized protein n=1 Tax=Ricinus communis TaxID=3988 RepID=B9SG39_RICCO|nr:uncharacterized protein LOC8285624 isoform X1 [Ricinus communis]XP_048232768.1 uncharacterized protein LOC8285624 isoform X1 [Ricinus communis]EEF37455.1 hypothetical protein RCOM_1155060 [Ricinus communis]|eukprot:XP_002524958.1 uncharacterized protein LOC8285624 isoform X1 [Ricinus communis]
MKKSIIVSKFSDTALVTGMAIAAIAAKRAGNNVPKLKMINGIPSPIFVLSFTLLSFVSVKLTRSLLTLWHGDAVSADISKDAEEEAFLKDQTPDGEGEIIKYATRKDRPHQFSCHLQQDVRDQAQEDQSEKQIELDFSHQGRLRRPSRKTISRPSAARSSINPGRRLPSSKQVALVDEMLSLFSKFQSELTPPVIDIQVALQNVNDALKTGSCILQDPEQVKKLKKALHLISTYRSEDSFSSAKVSVTANLEQEIDKLEAKFRNAEDVVTRTLQLQANKARAEKDFQEAYLLLKELKAKDDQIKDQIGNLKSEIESIKAAEKENLRKIIDCFESGKCHKDLATKCEMELARLGHATNKAKKDKADVEAAFKNYRQLFT